MARGGRRGFDLAERLRPRLLLRARDAGYAVPDGATSNSAAWIERSLQSGNDSFGGAYAQPAAPTQAYAAYVLARTSRVDPATLRALSAQLSHDGETVAWRNGETAAPMVLADLAGARSLMGQHGLADSIFQSAITNLDAYSIPLWWRNGYYWSPLREEAGVLAVAAETGHDAAVSDLMTRLAAEHLDPDQLNTQEKAWLPMAAHALARRGTAPSLALNGGAAETVALPYAVSLGADDIGRGATVRNAGDTPLFRTVTLRGAPIAAPPALQNGFRLQRATYALTRERIDDTVLRQTDRFIVVLSGRVDGDRFRRAMLIDPLPAGLEIEAPVVREQSYPFLGELTHLAAHEERDDRFLAAFDVGSDTRGRFRTVDDDKILPLHEDEFRVAYVVRAVTPGAFVRPETIGQDMYQPDVMARTDAARTSVTAR